MANLRFKLGDRLVGAGLVDIKLTQTTELPVISEQRFPLVLGEHLGTTLKRYTGSGLRAVLDAGVYEIIDNIDVNNYAVYGPKIWGLRGQFGKDKTIVRLRENSFSFKKARPGSAGDGVMRLGPNGGASGVQRTMSDITFEGRPQNGDDGLPMFFQGIWNYWGRKEFWQRVRVRGLTYGGGNSPKTGETFMVNNLRDVDSYFEDCDFDGRDQAGNYVSAAPIGFNGSTNPRLVRCWIHHSKYSGLTYSIAGTVNTPTTGVYTEDCVMEMTANHAGVGSGGRFSGINHEWVRGQIEHVRPTIILDQASLWDSNHISHGCDTLPDNPIPMIVRAPKWNASPTWARGLFTIKIWGNQSTLPLVYNDSDKLMKPMIATGTSPAMLPAVDSSGATVTPQTHFAISAGTGYVAP
jgi:hypothetical protein